MTPDHFRRIALGYPEAFEHEHMKHPDFRVGGRIFASLGYPKEGWGTVMFRPSDQSEFVKLYPEVFVPAAGSWGRAGCTSVLLSKVDRASLTRAIDLAYRNKAPSTLVAGLDGEPFEEDVRAKRRTTKRRPAKGAARGAPKTTSGKWRR